MSRTMVEQSAPATLCGRIEGFNLAFHIDGDVITVAALTGGVLREAPKRRITFTLCPKKLHAWRKHRQSADVLPLPSSTPATGVTTASPEPSSTPAPVAAPTAIVSPIDRMIESLTGLQIPAGMASLWMFP